MSKMYGKWNSEDIRKVMVELDKKTGMNGADLDICVCESFRSPKALGTYTPKQKNVSKGSFTFSPLYFNDPLFSDEAAVDVIRHEYCHFLVDALNLKEVYDDTEAHGIAWKTVCGLMNTDSIGYYKPYRFWNISEERFLHLLVADDIDPINIIEQIDRWGLNLPSMRKRSYMEKRLIKKFTKKGLFKVNDVIMHDTYGRGIVLDTMPDMNKQFLFVRFGDDETRIVQNRRVSRAIA